MRAEEAASGGFRSRTAFCGPAVCEECPSGFEPTPRFSRSSGGMGGVATGFAR